MLSHSASEKTAEHTKSSTRSAGFITLLSILAAFVVPVLVPTGQVAAAAKTIHVAPWGNDGGNGTSGAPFRTANRAVASARSGDTVMLRGGIYNESVQIYRKALHIRSANGERAVFDGTQRIEGFQANGGDWFYDGWTKQFRQTTGPMVHADHPIAKYPDQVFINGRPQRQVLSRAEVVPGTFWHETGNDRIWVGQDPTGARVEASNRSWGLYFNKADGSRLTNVTVRRYATEGRHMAAIRAYSDNLVFTGVISQLNAFSGISAIGSRIVIRDSYIGDNGYIGLHGHQLSTLVVERTAVVGNNKARFDAKHSAGGIKITSSTGITVRDSEVSRNDGPGIWTDIGSRYITLSRNIVESNGRSGIEIELSRNVNVVSNVAVGNGEAGIWILESQDVAVYHNAAYGNQREIWVLEGPRQDVQNVLLRNNIVGQGRGDQQALLNVDDWTEERSAQQMNVTSDYNAYWLPASSATKNVTRWARWGETLAISSTLAEHRADTNQDRNSVFSNATANPYVRNAATGDFRAQNSLRLGAAVYGSMATELGVAAGTRLRVGPVAVTPRRS